MSQIIISNATKMIKGQVVLADISAVLEKGGVYGFFGTNGSGKTMLFRAIAGLIHLTSGSIKVFGDEIGKDVSFPRNMGIVLSSELWEDATGFENLRLLASIRRKISDKEIRDTLERVGLGPNDCRAYRNYSLGMKRRLEIAQAIMEAPELLILDEPTNSLDSDGLAMVLEIVEEQKARGATILLASHNVGELEDLCDRKFKMERGSLSEIGS